MLASPVLTLATDPAADADSPVRAAVMGVTGYSGAELVRLLLEHPRLRATPPVLFGREGSAAVGLTEIHPQMAKVGAADSLVVTAFSMETLRCEQVDILFLALPPEQSRELVPSLIAAGVRVIDLSGAWRLDDPVNAAVYKLQDADADLAAQLQAGAVYGSPELHAKAIATARLVANPGCYATACILGLAPLVQANVLDLSAGIICDAKSGVSGAGKAPTSTTHFMHAADNLSAYAVFGHRHTGELLEQLHLRGDQVQFTPHLLPIPRGILATIYVRLAAPSTAEHVQQIMDDFYSAAPLVRVRQSPHLPQIQHVVRTPFCDIGFQLSPDGRRLVIVSCLDNLLKGAASQAVENFNLMSGFGQQEGLV
jgi:N-acetyl-gamma-glutamyl-phosphate reductase